MEPGSPKLNENPSAPVPFPMNRVVHAYRDATACPGSRFARVTRPSSAPAFVVSTTFPPVAVAEPESTTLGGAPASQFSANKPALAVDPLPRMEANRIATANTALGRVRGSAPHREEAIVSGLRGSIRKAPWLDAGSHSSRRG